MFSFNALWVLLQIEYGMARATMIPMMFLMRSDKTVESMNNKLRDVLQISTRHTGPSHMWTSETLAAYLEFLAIELRIKRAKHNLTASARALVLMDKAPQHGSMTFEKIREQFQRDHNCLLIHGGSYEHVAVPAGWGACGGPNDGWHQWFHGLRRAAMRMRVGMGDNPHLRKQLQDLSIAVDGNFRFEQGAKLSELVCVFDESAFNCCQCYLKYMRILLYIATTILCTLYISIYIYICVYTNT